MPYRYKEGDKGYCRDGVTKYEVLRALDNGAVVALITHVDIGLAAHVFQSSGMLYASPGSYDLLPPVRKIEGWVNVYANGGSSGIHHTRESADRAVCRERIACLHIVREYTQGEGLDNE